MGDPGHIRSYRWFAGVDGREYCRSSVSVPASGFDTAGRF